MTEEQPTTQHKGDGVPISKIPGVPISYDLTPARTALISVDFQLGFGSGSWEHVPHADAAAERFRALAARWRAAGGVVIHVHTTWYKGEKVPEGREAFIEGNAGASFYPGLVEDGDILIRKLGFSAVVGSNLLDVLKDRGFDTAIVGGLTTPICVETTVDGLSMAGIRVAVLSDATASQPIGDYSAELAHEFSIARMSYLMGQVTTTEELIKNVLDKSPRKQI
jgi:nicotinamidase-related amidase